MSSHQANTLPRNTARPARLEGGKSTHAISLLSVVLALALPLGGARAQDRTQPSAATPAVSQAANPSKPPADPTGAAATPQTAPAALPAPTPVDPAQKWAFCEVRAPKKPSKDVGYINPDSLFESSTYSFAASVPTNGSTVYFSGQIPVDTQYAVQGKTLVEQLHVALKNLCLAMQGAGVTTADVFKIGVTYVHKDAADPFVLAEELAEFFERDEMPVTTMTSTPFLVVDTIRVQVEATAFVRAGTKKKR